MVSYQRTCRLEIVSSQTTEYRRVALELGEVCANT